jgi:hypothetical protein
MYAVKREWGRERWVGGWRRKAEREREKGTSRWGGRVERRCRQRPY